MNRRQLDPIGEYDFVQDEFEDEDYKKYIPQRKSVTSKRAESFCAIDLSQDFSVKKPLKNTEVLSKMIETDSDFTSIMNSKKDKSDFTS